MHILHVSAVTNWGGGEYHIENLCNELLITNTDITNTVLCVKDSPFHERLSKTNIKHSTAALGIKIDLRYIFKIGKICRKSNIDLIHIHDPSALQLTIIADKIYNLPPFIFSKKTSFPIKNRKKTLYKYNYYKIKKILCVSKETQYVAEKAITDKSKLTTIYHGTNLKTKSIKTPFLIRDKYRIPPNKTIIGHIGNHIKAKHLETYINIAHHIINIEKLDEYIFVQIGTFSERTDALLQQVQKLNLKEHIIFLDYIPQASNFIPQFDISLMTSQSEGMPQFIYESMYHKTPIVSTNVGGIPELLTHEVNGFLANMHDHETLAKHVIKLKNSKKLQKQFTSDSYKKLLEQFTTENMAKQTVNIYKSLLSNA
ncbi:glycosyltransferase family 4 protein [Hyunsoonleella pacifica]|uniref:Glycosyltransferase n=1 Tax=Hyunsoonleella pacifica TaxID=1080224 RepID=A0A4Q9FRQ4_9FLAO|nr:glycosyltransferase family 4 protein [Hyunsoonleella pacifica]TBN17536.1 glycosyltransferase [Hyunsoonleella pacifica]GGD11107.1 N-acetyl-alpha-D-glucosaminyl L-malate synthase [Hyunsoonleella pacifica]